MMFLSEYTNKIYVWPTPSKTPTVLVKMFQDRAVWENFVNVFKKFIASLAPFL